MNERKRFILEATAGLFSHSELCRRHDISRKTGYKWLERYETEGPDGLLERSHRPHCCPHATEPHILEAAFELRRHRPRWGAAKILGRLLEVPPRLVATRAPGPAQTLPARGPSQQAAAPTQTLSSRSSHRALRCAQLHLVRRLQGAVQDPRRRLLLPAHRPGWLQPLPARLSGPRRDHLRRFQTRLHPPLPRVRHPRPHPHR